MRLLTAESGWRSNLRKSTSPVQRQAGQRTQRNQCREAMAAFRIYAFALPRNSTRRTALDVAVLYAIHSAWWEQTIFRYLGSR